MLPYLLSLILTIVDNDPDSVGNGNQPPKAHHDWYEVAADHVAKPVTIETIKVTMVT